jgi:hypothetical protein
MGIIDLFTWRTPKLLNGRFQKWKQRKEKELGHAP